MMENEYHITVNDSVFRTKCWGLHAVILLTGCFALQFVVYSLVDHMGIIHNHDMEEYMPEIALAVTVFVTCMYYFIREKRTNGVMKLGISFREDSVKISANGKDYIVKHDEITEVRKMMVIDRMHDKKGCYRMKIKCHGRSNLEFETTQQEYEAQLDFEKTELFIFYDACRKAGVKSC